MANKSSKPAAAAAAPAAGGGIAGWFSRNWCYVLAFFLPVALIYIAYLIFGLYPAGEHSVLCLDLNGQYVYYFETLRDAFHGDGSILYNWSRNLSGGFQGVIGYYLASPFTLIVILLPRTMILGALLIMILAKLGTASLAFCYYARKSKHVTPLMGVMLGTMFGMCAYGIIQTIDPMWLDGLVFLPFIALGVEYLIDDGRKLNYIIPLALMCVANFYIGFMCCIFTGLYFIYYFFFGSDKIKFKTGKDRKAALMAFLRMAYATAVALCCAAFMILPVYNALALGKFDFTKPDWSYKSQFNVLDFIAQFTCVNQYSSVNVQGKPEIYCGALAALCMPLYFLNKRVPLKKKLGYAFLLVSLFICMMVRPIDMLWHGGQMPNWLPFRYSFVFSFVMLSMAANVLHYATNIKSWHIAASYGGFFVFLMIVNHYVGLGADKLINEHNRMLVDQKGAVYLDAFKSVWLTLLFLAIYCFFVYLLTKKNPTKGMSVAVMVSLLAVVSVELTYNAKCEFTAIHKEVSYSSRKSYREYVTSGREMVDRLYEYDGGFYRAEKTYTRTVNDDAGFKLRGITHSSSVMNAKILTYIETMGYAASTYYSRYDGCTPIADSVLGIKYVFDKGDTSNLLRADKLAEDGLEVGAAYQKVYSDKAKSQSEEEFEVGVYKNPNALGIGYMVSEDILRVNAFGNDNPFNSQNILMSTISGNTTFTQGGGFDDWHKYYKPLTVTKEMRLNQVYTEPYGNQTNYREIKKEDGSHADDPTVDIFLETETAEPLYMFFKTENQSKVNLWLTDQWNEEVQPMNNVDGSPAKSLGAYFETDNYKIVYLGTYPQGQQLQLRMTLLTDAAGTKEKYTIIKDFFFMHFDSDLFEQDIQTLKAEEQQWNLTKCGGRTLEGTITAKEGQVMMTSIPAEPGWKVWVDGQPYTYEEVIDGKQVQSNYVTLFKAMIGVKLTPGEHTVKMRYTPPGFTTGLFALACGIFCLVMFYIHDRDNNAVLAKIRANRKKGIYELEYEDDPDPSVLERAKKAEQEKRAKQIEEISENMVADELRKLKALMDEGVLTKEEFDEQKKKLLNKKQ